MVDTDEHERERGVRGGLEALGTLGAEDDRGDLGLGVGETGEAAVGTALEKDRIRGRRSHADIALKGELGLPGAWVDLADGPAVVREVDRAINELGEDLVGLGTQAVPGLLSLEGLRDDDAKRGGAPGPLGQRDRGRGNGGRWQRGGARAGLRNDQGAADEAYN
eukprot:11648032-Alexandrium_andersonii.AAC.1